MADLLLGSMARNAGDGMVMGEIRWEKQPHVLRETAHTLNPKNKPLVHWSGLRPYSTHEKRRICFFVFFVSKLSSIIIIEVELVSPIAENTAKVLLV